MLSPSSRAEWVEIRLSHASPWHGTWSPSSRAEWVEIIDTAIKAAADSGLRPRGRSGLKFEFGYALFFQESPSSRAEWVEILLAVGGALSGNGLRPRGRSGLK